MCQIVLWKVAAVQPRPVPVWQPSSMFLTGKQAPASARWRFDELVPVLYKRGRSALGAIVYLRQKLNMYPENDV